ncbi:NUDIX domain-containing protein [Palleronia caenipelagi]|uniref:ADP-ribose pyrophosphatase n=1 Tax=Palleronia caenipelagi TaxID=2489174 RepID=A0A547Q7J5_9RHOB|nr:NUDIX domain-containing protein [Palleronia caenipelagi]TRD22352.1 NUDIX domain-containing protein [Palleronia caenipelagi]
MTDVFLFGTLRDPELLERVAGGPVMQEVGALPWHAIERAAAGDWPILVERPGAVAQGAVVRLTSEQVARLDYYEAGFAYVRHTARLSNGRPVMLYRAPEGQGAGVPWDLAEWQETSGPMTRLAAGEAMRFFGQIDGAALHYRMPQIRARAHSAIRAARSPRPELLRNPALRASVEILKHEVPYCHYFAVGQTQMRIPHSDGGAGTEVEWAGLHAADAVTVLPYDPQRDRVLLVEQFRYGIWLRGDTYPWSLEPIAGRVDAGESFEEAAHREAGEEAALTLTRLHKIGNYYPSPGVLAEYLVSYVAEADLPDTLPRLGGLAEENEDLRLHLISFDQLMELIRTGEANNGPLLVSALWLQRAREDGTFS